VKRVSHLKTVLESLQFFPIVALLGARQVGKTTLAKKLLGTTEGETHHFDLEDPIDIARLHDPMLALKPLKGLVVLDEIQRMPELFPILRVLADRDPIPARFLILGCASPNLARQSSESLAGRMIHHAMGGFQLNEVGDEHAQQLWSRGGFPRSFLAPDDALSLKWRKAFLRTFLEHDLPQLGFNHSPERMRRFWSMLAHYHGQTWNGAELARAFGVSETSVRRYLDVLGAVFMVRVLQPWHANLSKRQVRSPKIYIADTGLLHALLNIGDSYDLQGHPKVGASWEGFAIEEVLRVLGVDYPDAYFWSVHAGAELDLFVQPNGRKIGFEFKNTSSPKATRSMRSAVELLNLEALYVVHPGESSWEMAERIKAVPLLELSKNLKLE